MRTPIVIVTALCALMPQGSTAQEPRSVVPGTRVRVSAPSRELKGVVGFLVAQSGDSLYFRREHGGDTLGFPMRELTVDVSLHPRTHGWAGAGIGLLVGVAAGAIVGRSEHDDPVPPCEGWDCVFASLSLTSASEKATYDMIGYGLIGTIVGGIIGHHYETDRWESIVAPGPIVTTVSGARGRTLDVGMKIKMF